jgi:hypothetical protein
MSEDVRTEEPTPDQARAELLDWIDRFSDEVVLRLWRFLQHWIRMQTSPERGSAPEQG